MNTLSSSRFISCHGFVIKSPQNCQRISILSTVRTHSVDRPSTTRLSTTPLKYFTLRDISFWEFMVRKREWFQSIRNLNFNYSDCKAQAPRKIIWVFGFSIFSFSIRFFDFRSLVFRFNNRHALRLQSSLSKQVLQSSLRLVAWMTRATNSFCDCFCYKRSAGAFSALLLGTAHIAIRRD